MKEFFKTINWWVVCIIVIICRTLDSINPNLFLIFASLILILAIYVFINEYKRNQRERK